MPLGADGADARPSASVRDREGFVKVDVRDVASEVAGPRVADEGIEVRAVDVDLSSGLVDGGGHVPHVRFKRAVSRRIRDHEGADASLVVGQRLAQGVHVGGAVARRAHDDHLESRQRG